MPPIRPTVEQTPMMALLTDVGNNSVVYRQRPPKENVANNLPMRANVIRQIGGSAQPVTEFEFNIRDLRIQSYLPSGTNPMARQAIPLRTMEPHMVILRPVLLITYAPIIQAGNSTSLVKIVYSIGELLQVDNIQICLTSEADNSGTDCQAGYAGLTQCHKRK